MFKRISYMTAFIVLATAVVLSPQIIDMLKKVPYLGEFITKNEQ